MIDRDGTASWASHPNGFLGLGWIICDWRCCGVLLSVWAVEYGPDILLTGPLEISFTFDLFSFLF
jgi:hypothetical protein